MNMTRVVRALLPTGLGLLALIGPACANGINPPRPSGGATVALTCTDRASGKAVTVQRARVGLAEPGGTLELRIGDSATASARQLAQVARLKIATAKPAADGFAAAMLTLQEPAYQGPGFVRLAVDGKALRLTGFGADLARIDRSLASCAVLAVQPATPPPPPASAAHFAPK